MQSEDGLYETRFEPFPVVGLDIAVNSEDNPLIPGMNGSWGGRSCSLGAPAGRNLPS